MQVTIRDAGDVDLPAILDIVNDAVLNTTAIWTNHAFDLENRRAWLHERQTRSFPVLVAEFAGEVAGFASFGEFRKGDGYEHTVEHSIYVHRHHHGKGVGRQMMPPLFDRARHLGKHVMIGGVEAGNAASLHFHQALGFSETGRLLQVGQKFDRWLDLVFMQKILD
jgi:L-amino acid N-acyltransferase